MTMFVFNTVGFDANAHYNVIPVPPTEKEERYGLRIVSDCFSDKIATLLFTDVDQRNAAMSEFITLLNTARAA